MNTFLKQALVALALSATLVAGPASAISTGNLRADVQSAAGSGNVNVSLDDGVATLTGDVDSLSRLAAARAALADPSVDSVVNLIDAN